MRRRAGSGIGGLCALVLVAVTGLAGCGRPSGVDGDLANGWPALPEAKVPVPVAAVCYTERTSGTWYGDSDSVPCTDTHDAETVFVGTYSGSAADRTSPPDEGSPDQATAYGQCLKNSADYLGAAYESGNLELLLVQPDDAAWTGGGRWFRCDIVRYKDAGQLTIDDSASSVKDGLRGSQPLVLTCKTVTDDGNGNITAEQFTDCAQPHNSEYAGLFTGPDVAWPSSETTRDNLASNGCEAVVAKFLGFTGSTVDSQYLGWEYSAFNEDQWALGDRTIACSVLGFSGNSSNGARFVGSVKGIKGGKPKS
jgi:hypothetical protein